MIGQPPGTLAHRGERRQIDAKISVFDYDLSGAREFKDASIEKALEYKNNKKSITWINIDGIHEEKMIARLGERFGLTLLVMEDILNTTQRPKIEEYEEGIFLILKMIFIDPKSFEVTSEQLSLILGKNFVLSFQEKAGDVFDQIRERIRTGSCKIRHSGADFLAYSLIDAVVDYYFEALENFGERIEEVEYRLINNPQTRTLNDLYELKTAAIFLRKSIWPLREVISRLEKMESPLISASLQPYLRDVYDHAIQVIETVETYRDLLSGMLDLYLSSVSNRMNEVMKMLTIIATIFIPLTFIAGLYGMNFSDMPVQKIANGWVVIWSVMLSISLFMLMFFKRKKWL
jgi:magnesium transporter